MNRLWCAEAYSDDEEEDDIEDEENEEDMEEEDTITLKKEYCLLRYGFISDWDTSQVSDMRSYFANNMSLMKISVAGTPAMLLP
jgi:hypothetical protein